MYVTKFPDLQRLPYMSYDTETTGLVYPKDKVFGFSLTIPSKENSTGFVSYYFDIRRQPEAVRWFNKEMEMYEGVVYMINAHFDSKMSHNTGINIPLHLIRDVSIYAVSSNENELLYSLDHLAQKYIGEKKDDSIYEKLAALFGGRPTRAAQMPNLHRAPVELVAPYAKQDALVTLKLALFYVQDTIEQDNQDIIDFEHHVFPYIQRMTRRGIPVNVKTAEKAIDKLTIIIDAAQKELDVLVGFKVNVNSAPQMKTIFKPVQKGEGRAMMWFADNGFALETTDKGGPSISSPIMRNMKGDRRAELIVSIRSNIKTRDTFLKGHVIGHAVNGRVYPSINQNKGEDAGTGTGRLSYVEPALQQIPSRNKVVAEAVKECFEPEEGEVWVSFDMSSQEFRVFAHLVNNEKMVARFHADPTLDFHQMVADLTHLPRSARFPGEANAKTLNLAAVFNTGNGAIAEDLGMPFEWTSFTARDGSVITYKKAGAEAMSVIEQYHSNVPGIKDLAERAKKVAETRGYVRTRYGRRFRFPRGHKSYKASGIVIQMTSADVNKDLIVRLSDAAGDDATLLLNVHDSFEFSMKLENIPIVLPRLFDVVRNDFGWVRVPMVIEANGYGKNYWEASSGKNKLPGMYEKAAP